jgi:alanyl-tRNA synthetase
MDKKLAKERGAMGVFDERYEERVKIYSIGFPQQVYSMEICGGPHVKNTSEIGQFKIVKQESAGAGVRRLRAHLL